LKKKRLYITLTLIIIIIVSAAVFFQLTIENNSNQIHGIVDFSNTYATVSTIYERKTFLANGTFWLFYSNGSNLFYTNSLDGLNWGKPTTISAGPSASAMSVWYDGKVHFAYASGVPGQPVIYKQGQIIGDTINWSNPQIVVKGEEAYEYYNGYVTVDSFGNPWVSDFRYDNTAYSASRNPYTIQFTRANSSSGDSWTVPMEVVNDSFSEIRPCIIPLAEGKMYAIFATADGIQGRLWSGSEWQQIEIVTNRTLVHNFGYSAVSLEGEVNLATLENSSNNVLHYRRLTNGTWEENVIATKQDPSSQPVLSVDSSKNVLYCLWFQGTSLQLRKWQAGNWQKVATENLVMTSPTALSCFYNVSDGKLGVALLEKISQQEEIYRIRYFVLPNL